MGVYRSDQAQLTFGAEAYPGAYAEESGSVTNFLIQSGTQARTKGVISAGSRTMVMDTLAGTNFTTTNYENWIGTSVSIDSLGLDGNQHAETRRIEHMEYIEGSGSAASYTAYLNAPTAFPHEDNGLILPIYALNTNASEIFIDQIPGVYETVDVPDPDNAIEARYFLGTTSRRNFFSAYRGQQSYVGSVPGFVLLNGKPLRYPIGRVVSRASNKNPTAFTVPVQIRTAGGAYWAKKGEVYVHVSTTSNSNTQEIADDTIIVFDGIDSNATIDTAAPSNDSSTGTKCEIRRVVAGGTAPINNTYITIKLDHPLTYDHASGSIIKYYNSPDDAIWEHTIIETVDLDSLTWHVHMKDSSELATNDFDRRYFGGKVGSATLAADEGGMLTMSWDGVNFLGMVHNQKAQNDANASGQYGTGEGNGITNNTLSRMTLPYYSVMQDISTAHIDFPNSEPYYFSQGSISMFGQEIARIRSFALTIANNEEPRYYLQKRYGRNRGPVEIREQQREYSLAVTLALPDAARSEGSEYWSTASTVFKELILEGNYGDGVKSKEGMKGFNVSLTFERAVNDSITITIPDDGTAAEGGNQQGAFIRTAPHSITGDNPLQVDADILFRNMKVVIKDPDNNSFYYP
mgnify:CR=1 FL=1